MTTVAEHGKTLSNLQLELLKSLKYMVSEKQVTEIKSLLRFYFAQQLDVAIDEVENERKYTAEIYESWLKANNNEDNNFSVA